MGNSEKDNVTMLSEHVSRIDGDLIRSDSRHHADMAQVLTSVQSQRLATDIRFDRVDATLDLHTMKLDSLTSDVSEIKRDIADLKSGMRAILAHLGINPDN